MKWVENIYIYSFRFPGGCTYIRSVVFSVFFLPHLTLYTHILFRLLTIEYHVQNCTTDRITTLTEKYLLHSRLNNI